MNIKSISQSERCEVCHLKDEYDPNKNWCKRCDGSKGSSGNFLKKLLGVTTFTHDCITCILLLATIIFGTLAIEQWNRAQALKAENTRLADELSKAEQHIRGLETLISQQDRAFYRYMPMTVRYTNGQFGFRPIFHLMYTRVGIAPVNHGVCVALNPRVTVVRNTGR